MAVYLLCHRHKPRECEIAFAAWRGFDSPLRHRSTLCSCLHGGHSLWWRVDAEDPAAARALLPPYVARRTEVEAVSEATIP